MRKSKRILLVDPCIDTVMSLAWLLRSWGHEVEAAHTGPEALELATCWRPDAVLLELRLPGLDGYALAQALRRQEEFREVPFVAITGYSGATFRRRSREAGFAYHLVKPVEPLLLRDLLVHLLECPSDFTPELEPDEPLEFDLTRGSLFLC